MENTEQSDPAEWGPLALHIRRLRLWHGDGGMSQRELAELAGVSVRMLRAYEDCRALPQLVVFLLAVALALKVPMEWLFAPEILEKMKQTIEGRRLNLQRRPETKPDDPTSRAGV